MSANRGTTIRTNVEFGKEYVDMNSGFRGACVAVAQWQFGCIRITLQPKVDREGKLPGCETFDESSLEGIKPVVERTGGPIPAPTRNMDPLKR